jgi:hypothetical protein
MMKRLRRVNGTLEMIARPLTATEVNGKVVIPPRTAEGMAVMAAANLEKIPAAMRKRLYRWHENPSAEKPSCDSPTASTYFDLRTSSNNPLSGWHSGSEQ